MSRETIHSILMGVGVVVLVLSLFADQIGFGSYPGINSAQLVGIALGLAVLIFGYWLGRTRAEEK
jgi:hypothetical protein